MGGPEMAPHTPPHPGGPRQSRGAPRYAAAPRWPPIPPNARARPGKAVALLVTRRPRDGPPYPPTLGRAPAKPWRSSLRVSPEMAASRRLASAVERPAASHSHTVQARGATPPSAVTLLDSLGFLGDLRDPPEGLDPLPVALRHLRDLRLAQRDGVAVRLIGRALVVGERRELLLAREGGFDGRPQLLQLPRLPLRLLVVELGHDVLREQLERFADVLVPVPTALLDENRLVHARILKCPQRLAELRRRADAAGAPTQNLRPDLVAHRDEPVPDVGPARRVPAEDVVVGQRELEEPEPVAAAAARLLSVRVTGKARDHRDVRVHGVADRNALALERLVVVRRPLRRLRRVDEGEGERADPELRGEVDGLAVRAGDPDRRVGLLHGLRQHVARGHREELPAEAGIRVHRHHVGDLLDGLAPHRAPVPGLAAETPELS